MNTNSRLCPNCRSPLHSTSCKRCGFKQKTLKIVETQDYGKSMNYGSRIQHVRQVSTLPKRLTERQKLLLYLKQYQQLMKKAASRIVQRQDDRELGLQFMEQVQFIWEAYLLKCKQTGLGFAGMFRKYIRVDSNHQQKCQRSDPSKIQNHEQNAIKMEGTQEQAVKEQQQPTRKRGRGRKATKSDQPLSILTQFRCFFNVSVKPLILDSIEERRINGTHCMTACQKSYLAYLLNVRTFDTQFIQFATSKYLKMVIGLRTQPLSNFLREKDIEQELNRRNCSLLKRKDHSSMLVLLIDLLICWNNERIESSNRVSVREMLEWYGNSSQGSEIIDRLKLQLDDNQQEKDVNVPIINYQLVYSIMYLAACRVGLCLSVGEVVTICSKLEIGRIAIPHEQNQFLAAVVNEESINVVKTRRTAHLLAFYLGITPICCMAKWSEKWCIKLGLQKHLAKVYLLNSLLFGQVKETTRGKLSLYEEMLHDGKMIQYHRYLELQQDIASLAAIMLLLKLSNGLTEYPYLIHSTPDELLRNYSIDQPEMKIMKDLIADRQLTIKDKSNNSIRTQQLPRIYEQPICVLDIAKKLSQMSKNDKEIGRNSIQRQIIRLRNLSHLNYVPIIQLTEHFRKAKEDREEQQREKKGVIVQLRFDEMTHKQRVREHQNVSKNMRAKKCLGESLKQSAKLNDNLIRQLQCIVGKDDQVVEAMDQQQPTLCLLDHPSSNYELMYDYGDNLILAGRQRQLYFMQMLCLNLCTLAEMIGWIARYEAALKQFERD